MIIYTHYKNSFLATMIDLIGSAVVLIGILAGLTEFSSINNLSEGVSFFLGIIFIVILGVLIKKGARNIAQKNVNETLSSNQKGKEFSPKHFKRIVVTLVIISIVADGLGGMTYLYSRAQKAFQAGDYQKAIVRYEEIIEKYPDEVKGYIGAADVYAELAEQDRNYFANALDCLKQAKKQGITDEALGEKKKEIKKHKKYFEQVDKGNACMQDGKVKKARKFYKEAISILEGESEAYEGMIKTYIAKNDKKNALKWLNKEVVLANVPIEKQEFLKQTVYLKQIHGWMKEKENILLREWFFSEEADEFMSSVEAYNLNSTVDGYSAENLQVFFKGNEVVPAVESGKALIVSRYGAYLGEIANWERSGEGRQLFVDYQGDEERYYLITGTWENNKVNGPAKYIEYFSPISDGSRWKLKYEGTFKENLFDGSIKFTWNSKETGEKGWATITADEGSFECIRKEGEQYIYAESEESSWAKSSEESLQNQFIPEYYLY